MASAPTRRSALLLDVGGVVLRSGQELMAELGRRRPELAGVTARRGPFGPEPDRAWERMRRREITERHYWAVRAEEFGDALGEQWETQDLMAAMYGMAGEPILRPETEALLAEATATGIDIGALTNDLRDFHPQAGIEELPAFTAFSVIVDGSVTGVLKPDPRAYATAAEALGRPPGEIVFVDDMPWNVDGARTAGMQALELDVTDPAGALRRARRALGIGIGAPHM